MNRPSNIVRLRSVRPIADAELSRIVGDPDAAFRRDNIVDFERHRLSRVYRRMCAELDRCPPRQYRIEPRIDWSAIIAWWALALSVGIFLYFGAQLLRAVLS